jgi:hypothetical protein
MPSLIASSQMTLATPIKIPSTVSNDRNGCKSRLFVPSLSVLKNSIKATPVGL